MNYLRGNFRIEKCYMFGNIWKKNKSKRGIFSLELIQIYSWKFKICFVVKKSMYFYIASKHYKRKNCYYSLNLMWICIADYASTGKKSRRDLSSRIELLCHQRTEKDIFVLKQHIKIYNAYLYKDLRIPVILNSTINVSKSGNQVISVFSLPIHKITSGRIKIYALSGDWFCQASFRFTCKVRFS